MDRILTCKTTDKKTTIKDGRKTAAVINLLSSGKFELFVPLTRISGIGGKYDTLTDAISGAKEILTPFNGDAILISSN
jgi:hypothetical protein